MCRFQEIDVYWAVQNGRRRSVALSETEALNSIRSLETYETGEWQIEKLREAVAVVTGTLVEGEGLAIELLDDDGYDASEHSYKSRHVFWKCPLCKETHNGSIFSNPVDHSSVLTNPSLWFCEQGRGIVLVGW